METNKTICIISYLINHQIKIKLKIKRFDRHNIFVEIGKKRPLVAKVDKVKKKTIKKKKIQNKIKGKTIWRINTPKKSTQRAKRREFKIRNSIVQIRKFEIKISKCNIISGRFCWIK